MPQLLFLRGRHKELGDVYADAVAGRSTSVSIRIAEELVCQLDPVAALSRRKEQRSGAVRQLGAEYVRVRDRSPFVEHAIGLVDLARANSRSSGMPAALEQVHEAPGRGDQHIKHVRRALT